MFTYNFKYELKSLLRSRWIILLFAILLIVVLFAGYNGNKKVNKRLVDIEKVTSAVEKKDKAMLSLLDSIEKGLKNNARSWRMPNDPMGVGFEHPRVAALHPKDLAFISVGQSDLFTHFVQPKIYGDNFALNYSELSSPIQLLFGSFDLSFVIIYILPLIIIAFSYNILSNEKEYGSLKLLAAQPISVYSWLLQKVGLRFLWLALITVLVLTISFGVVGFDFANNIGEFSSLLLLTISYILFWFVVALMVNIFIGSSAKNAVSLLGIWVFVILIIPAVVSQFSNVVYPIPSRTKMLSEIRKVKDQTAKKQDKILDNFLRDHPEYASKGGNINYTFWHKYIATQDLIEEELKPLLDSYNNQLQNQQQWIKRWQYISPAVIMQQSFNELAGTSTKHYQDYRKQVAEFSVTWRDFFTPMLYNNQPFQSKIYKDLPQFEYKEPKMSSMIFNTFIVLVFSILTLLISSILYQRKIKKESIIIG
ncbi:DUF3526 domain-containing protein [Pseudotenacibaculum sp. MALMAid0570]|uniref:DUF3526 domain-containing protein n=1 Tax=Pseudotenacibaculum sp. MALMAid0570 TaxID=3143938 RepID=UPI0032DFB371